MPPDPAPAPKSTPSARASRWLRRGRTSGPPIPLWLVVLVVVVLVALGWWFLGREADPETPLPLTGTPPTPGAAPPVQEAPAAPLDLPPLEESDGVVSTLVGALSDHPRWAAWLVTDELATRFVGAVAGVAAGVSPAAQVPFLAPEGPFTVREGPAGDEIDPASYRRYDALTEAFVSFETDAAVRLFQQLTPLFEEAHRQLGFPPGSFGLTMATALDNLLVAEVPSEVPAVELDVQTYLLSDPALESLPPIQKQLLRMGPDNTARVQGKLRQLRDGLVAAGAIPRR